MHPDLAAFLESKVRPPACVVLGSPAGAADLAAGLGTPDVVCYQMDLYQAGRLREELAARNCPARVETAADLWDLPADFQTVVYPAPERGERSLKIDMVEQAYHVLRPRGNLVVWSAHERDQLFPELLKKVFGRVHSPAAEGGMLLWSRREGDRPRRRHEITFQARFDEGRSLRFLTRPGVFSYGRFDDGARALVECMEVGPGDRVLDVGCGCGTNGVYAGLLGGPESWVTFVDSNVRAAALAEHNARANGLARFEAVASAGVEVGAGEGFDVALANPPYYGQGDIARLFAERARALLRPGGRLYLVTKQPDQVGPMVADLFGTTEVMERRGYVVLAAGTEAD